MNLLLVTVASHIKANPAEGVYWMLIDGDGKLEASVINGELQVKVIALKKSAQHMLDEKNPDETLRGRPLLGLTVMEGFRWNEKQQHWEGGKVYDPDKGILYDGYIWSEPKTGALKVRGYLLIGWFGRTETFERVGGKYPKVKQSGEPDLAYSR
ncbi:MAG: DUF2147 domain-containing protein [Verrucomicrobiota bacterium]